MMDRTPTKVLANGAIRYGVYDEYGNFLRYEYIKPEDMPTQNGTPFCMDTMLKVATAALYGKDATAVPDDIFVKIDALLKVKPFVTGTYTGNGDGQSINLRFQPAIVIVFQYGFITSGNAIYGGLAFAGVPLANNGVNAIMTVATGFSVYTNSANSSHCNDSGAPYTYIAFK